MSRIWWQFTDWDSDNITVWEPNQLPNYCTIFRSAWINQWLGWKYYIHGRYPHTFAYPYKVAHPYNFPDSPNIDPNNGFGEWTPEQYFKWEYDTSWPHNKDYYVLEHTLGKQYLPDSYDGGPVKLRVEDHRFAWWNSEGILNITGVNHGVLRSYPERGCARDIATPTYFDCLDRLKFWKKLPELYHDDRKSDSPDSAMFGLPVSTKNKITVPDPINGGDWDTFDDHDFVVGAFEAPYEEDGEGNVSGTLPPVPKMDVYTKRWFYPDPSGASWNLQMDRLRLWLTLMRNRFDAAGAFWRQFGGGISSRAWYHANSPSGEWSEHPNNVTARAEMAYEWNAYPSPWHIRTYFIDPDYTNPNPHMGAAPDNTFKNIIGCTDTNFNYAIVSCEATNYPAGGAPFDTMPPGKWYCHEIIDFSKSGTTLDSKLSQKLGIDALGNTPELPATQGVDYFSYSRNVSVVQYPRKKLPPDFWSFDQPPGVSSSNIWGAASGD